MPSPVEIPQTPYMQKFHEYRFRFASLEPILSGPASPELTVGKYSLDNLAALMDRRERIQAIGLDPRGRFLGERAYWQDKLDEAKGEWQHIDKLSDTPKPEPTGHHLRQIAKAAAALEVLDLAALRLTERITELEEAEKALKAKKPPKEEERDENGNLIAIEGHKVFRQKNGILIVKDTAESIEEYKARRSKEKILAIRQKQAQNRVNTAFAPLEKLGKRDLMRLQKKIDTLIIEK